MHSFMQADKYMDKYMGISVVENRKSKRPNDFPTLGNTDVCSIRHCHRLAVMSMSCYAPNSFGVLGWTMVLKMTYQSKS